MMSPGELIALDSSVDWKLRIYSSINLDGPIDFFMADSYRVLYDDIGILISSVKLDGQDPVAYVIFPEAVGWQWAEFFASVS